MENNASHQESETEQGDEEESEDDQGDEKESDDKWVQILNKSTEEEEETEDDKWEEKEPDNEMIGPTIISSSDEDVADEDVDGEDVADKEESDSDNNNNDMEQNFSSDVGNLSLSAPNSPEIMSTRKKARLLLKTEAT